MMVFHFSYKKWLKLDIIQLLKYSQISSTTAQNNSYSNNTNTSSKNNPNKKPLPKDHPKTPKEQGQNQTYS